MPPEVNRAETTPRLDQRILEVLRSSMKTTGQLQDIMKCQQHPHKILLGNHREGVGGEELKVKFYDVEGLAKKMGVSHLAAEELVRINGDVHRRVPKVETRKRITRLAELLVASGASARRQSDELSCLDVWFEDWS